MTDDRKVHLLDTGTMHCDHTWLLLKAGSIISDARASSTTRGDPEPSAACGALWNAASGWKKSIQNWPVTCGRC